MNIELDDLREPFLQNKESADITRRLGPPERPSESQRTSGTTPQLAADSPAYPPKYELNFSSLANVPVSETYTVDFEGHSLMVDPLDWRHSTLLKLQIFSGFCNFILFGLSDQTIGTVIPILEKDYNINDAHTGLIFLASTAGYFVMALVTEIFHRRLGVRGVGLLGGASMCFAAFVNYHKPPFYVFILTFFLAGVGCGSLDASLNGFMGNLVDLNQLLGILHGCYGIGCMILPPLVTHLLERKVNPWHWNDYYLVLATIAACTMVLFAFAFRHETPKKYKFTVILNEARKWAESEKNASTDDFEIASMDSSDIENSSPVASPSTSKPGTEDALAEAVPLSVALTSKLVWYFAIVMFLYVGAEVAFGTWLITFLTRVKDFPYKNASYMATTFWTGLTLGRICLGFVTAHYFSTELTANFCYIALSCLGHVAFAVAALTRFTGVLFPIVLGVGLFVGPIFPTTITAAIRVLPVKFHATGVGFICAFGGGGAAAMPFLIGLVAQSSTLGLLFYPSIIVVFYGILWAAWAVLKVRF